MVSVEPANQHPEARDPSRAKGVHAERPRQGGRRDPGQTVSGCRWGPGPLPPRVPARPAPGVAAWPLARVAAIGPDSRQEATSSCQREGTRDGTDRSVLSFCVCRTRERSGLIV